MEREPEQEGRDLADLDGPLVVGAVAPASASDRPRRDQATPPTWARDVELFDVPDHYVAPVVPARTVSTITLVIVGLLVLFLVGMVVDFALAVAGESAPATLALGFIYGVVIQILGWWTVIHLLRHR